MVYRSHSRRRYILMITDELMNLLGSYITWNNKSHRVNSIAIEEEGIQVYCDDKMWYYLRDGEWKIYSELDEEDK